MWFLRRAASAALFFLALVLVAALLVVERGPRVGALAPDAAAALAARGVAEDLGALLDPEAGIDRLEISVDEANGLLASAGRVLPGFASRVGIAGDLATVDLGVGMAAPVGPGDWWVNLHLAIGPSEAGLDLRELKIGRVPLPAALVLPLARPVLDRWLGDRLGTRTLDQIVAVRLDPDRIEISLAPGSQGRADLLADLRLRLRGAGGTDHGPRVYAHLWTYNQAWRRREIPVRGSAVPYLRHAITEAAAKAPDGDAAAEMQAALYALALYCGDARFGAAIGVSLNEGLKRSRCRFTTLGARHDLRQHFTLSAGIAAASSGEALTGIGELKELLDSNEGGSGFSFEDMAANLAGARFARTLLDLPKSAWADFAARIGTEADVLPALDGLPSGLTAAEFRARFSAVDSPEYTAVVAEIQARIDALPLYRDVRIN